MAKAINRVAIITKTNSSEAEKAATTITKDTAPGSVKGLPLH